MNIGGNMCNNCAKSCACHVGMPPCSYCTDHSECERCGSVTCSDNAECVCDNEVKSKWREIVRRIRLSNQAIDGNEDI